MARPTKSSSRELEKREGMTAKLGVARACLDLVRTRVCAVTGTEAGIVSPALSDLDKAEDLIKSVQRELVSHG